MWINYELINKEKWNLLQSSFFTINNIKTKEDLKVFMKSHIYSVWDFMSLIKALQNEITNTSIPWKPSKYSWELNRFINEMVLEEESDESILDWIYISHFELYLKAMEEMGIDISEIKQILYNINNENINELFENKNIPNSSRKFMAQTFKYIQSWDIIEIASAFTFARENIIPEMFIEIIKKLKISNIEAPTLYYYLKRHIEIDWDSHWPLSKKLIEKISDNNKEKIEKIEQVAIESIKTRKIFWEDIQNEIKYNNIKLQIWNTQNQI